MPECLLAAFGAPKPGAASSVEPMVTANASVSTPIWMTLGIAIALGVVGAGAGYYLAGPGAQPLAAPGQGEEIVLAIQPTDNAAAIQAKADELEAFLEQRSGLRIRVVVPLTYTGTIEALRFGHADVAMMSAWPARLAHDVAGAEVVLAEQREVIVDGQLQVKPHYFSYYVVKADSSAQRLEDLRGKTVAYPSLTSTSGYVYPVARLAERGLIAPASAGKAAEPKDFFGNVLLAGGYAQAWESLKNGQADVAVTAGDINANLFREVMQGTRILETQGPIPSHAVVVSKDFAGTPQAAKLQQAFLELKGEHKELMRKLVSGIFVEFQSTTTAEHTAALDAALEKTGLRHQDRLG
jgi:phosphonate transport system substrate-binding protein